MKRYISYETSKEISCLPDYIETRLVMYNGHETHLSIHKYDSFMIAFPFSSKHSGPNVGFSFSFIKEIGWSVGYGK